MVWRKLFPPEVTYYIKKVQSFKKDVLQITNKHMKRCSMSLIIREMQIITTMRYHLTPFRMAIIRKSTNNK